MSERELDAEVARKVMGWEVHFRNTAFWVDAADANKLCDRVLASVGDWRPSTDPAADYEVLKHVREQWDAEPQAEFKAALEDIWQPRSRSRGGLIHFYILAYAVGDYSRAALAALRAGGKEQP